MDEEHRMESKGRLVAALMSRGVRITGQRKIILDVIETANQHLDAAQILRKAKHMQADIDRVTVYRTLSLLKRHRLVDELDLMHVKGEGHYYERRPERDHVHITCLRCASVLEFESELLERLKSQVRSDCNFHILITRLEIGGYCHRCRSGRAHAVTGSDS
jgi:Fur family transcriptional regulator, ferric uptake regulator